MKEQIVQQHYFHVYAEIPEGKDSIITDETKRHFHHTGEFRACIPHVSQFFLLVTHSLNWLNWKNNCSFKSHFAPASDPIQAGLFWLFWHSLDWKGVSYYSFPPPPPPLPPFLKNHIITRRHIGLSWRPSWIFGLCKNAIKTYFFASNLLNNFIR